MRGGGRAGAGRVGLGLDRGRGPAAGTPRAERDDRGDRRPRHRPGLAQQGHPAAAGAAGRYAGGLAVTYSFPITGGNPSLSPLGGDIYHAGGINFASLTGKHLEIGKFDISLAAGTIYADQVNYAPGRIAVLDLGLSGLKVTHRGSATVLSGITLRLDPAAASALDATFGLSLPTDGSLVFGTAVVTLRN